jgi:hypothetical protein
MYYLAVMDCEDEVHSVHGENKYGRVEIEAEMTQDDDQFSYEKQGTITVDTLLLIAFMALFDLNCVDLNKFILKNESRNSPHSHIYTNLHIAAVEQEEIKLQQKLSTSSVFYQGYYNNL